MTYFVLSALVVALIYVNVLGMWKGYKKLPEGQYKDTLWKYKKMEIIEKGVISLIFIAVIFSMKYSKEVAMISLVAMAAMMAIEGLFGKYIRKNLVCPHCGRSIWPGNYIVLIKPRKWCPHCNTPLVEIEKHDEE